MPRHIKSRIGEKTQPADIDKFLGKAPRKRSAGSLRKKHIEEVAERMRRKDWDGMTPGKLVALYWICHEMVYGHPPVEIDKVSAWEIAMKAAGSMVRRHFDGDIERAITFMRWVWTREQEREKWRRENKRDGQRLTWRNQFTQDFLISDWLTAGERRRR